MSAPDEKPRPAPVISTERTEGSAQSSRIAWFSSRPNWSFQALSRSGRLSVISATDSSTLRLTVSYDMELLSRRAVGGELIDTVPAAVHE